jgi:hypothetical protein
VGPRDRKCSYIARMKATSRVLATATAAAAGTSTPLKAAPMALLPPLPLYRRILRGHRNHLPAEMRILGDMYVKKEFRDHRDVENPIHIVSPLPHPIPRPRTPR